MHIPEPIIELTEEKNIYRLFEFSVILKGIHAIIEILGGIAFFFVPTSFITHTLIKLSQIELFENPHDWISNHIIAFSHHLTNNSKFFIIFYLLSHGIVKLVLAIALLKDKHWAYPVSIITLIIFIIYQMYRYTFTFSIWLILLSIYDLIVLWLIWHEYKLAKKHVHPISH